MLLRQAITNSKWRLEGKEVNQVNKGVGMVKKAFWAENTTIAKDLSLELDWREEEIREKGWGERGQRWKTRKGGQLTERLEAHRQYLYLSKKWT